MIDPSLADHLLAGVFGFLLPLVSGWRSARAFKTIRFTEPLRKRFFISNSLSLWLVTLAILFVWWVQGRSLETIGLGRIPVFSLAVITLSLVFIALYALDAWRSLKNGTGDNSLRDEWLDSAPFLPTAYRELPAYALMCVTAGFCEEVVFRGFMINYSLAIFPNHQMGQALAIGAPALVFAAAHYYQGIRAVIKIAVLSILFGYIFFLSKSLWIVILLHFLIDFAGGLIGIRYRREPAPDEYEIRFDESSGTAFFSEDVAEGNTSEPDTDREGSVHD